MREEEKGHTSGMLRARTAPDLIKGQIFFSRFNDIRHTAVAEAEGLFGAIDTLHVLPRFQDDVPFAGMDPGVDIAFAPYARMEAGERQCVLRVPVHGGLVVGEAEQQGSVRFDGLPGLFLYGGIVERFPVTDRVHDDRAEDAARRHLGHGQAAPRI